MSILTVYMPANLVFALCTSSSFQARCSRLWFALTSVRNPLPPHSRIGYFDNLPFPSLAFLPCSRKPKAPVYNGVHARVPEPVVFNYVKSPVQAPVIGKTKAKLPETSGFGQLQKKLKVSG